MPIALALKPRGPVPKLEHCEGIAVEVVVGAGAAHMGIVAANTAIDREVMSRREVVIMAWKRFVGVG